MKSFKDYGLIDSILSQLDRLGFKEPTPIQDRSIPYILSGKDILGSAGTGTGKTGAFGIPLVTHLLASRENKALVLLPTRELALQVIKALQDFIGQKHQLSTSLIIGGDDMLKQFAQLKKNPQLIVGTPGRINDHLNRGSIKLSNINFLVLDEVDRMLDMGFGVQLDKIVEHLPKERQTLMFSATIPQNIRKLSTKYLTNPVEVAVDSGNKSPSNIKQEDVNLTNEEKYPYLMNELSNRVGSIIVFIKSKYSADSMAKKLRKSGHEAEAFHGDLRQNKRNQVIARFRKQDYRILIATDIAARGLDIPHIEHVINYDLPQCPEDYIHRIGRTARAGASGQALNLITQSDAKKWIAIQRMMNPKFVAPPNQNTSKRSKKKDITDRKKSGNPKLGGNVKFGGNAKFGTQKKTGKIGAKNPSKNASKSPFKTDFRSKAPTKAPKESFTKIRKKAR